MSLMKICILFLKKGHLLLLLTSILVVLQLIHNVFFSYLLHLCLKGLDHSYLLIYHTIIVDVIPC